MTTTAKQRASTRVVRPSPICKTRAAFAHGIAFEEFGYKNGRPLIFDYAGFQDRLPHEKPRTAPDTAWWVN